MKKTYAVLSGLIVLVAGGCASKLSVAAELAALRAVDLEMLEAGPGNNSSYFAEDASVLPPNAPIVAGREAIRGLWSEFFSVPGSSLSWQASDTQVSRAGDLGYTIGTYKLTQDDPAGNPATDRGKYVTIWKKQKDGQWKIALDIWNSDQPPPAPQAP